MGMAPEKFDGGDDLAPYRAPKEASMPFYGSTEAGDQFHNHPVERRVPARRAREHGIGVGEGDFKGDTENRQAFPGHKVGHTVECVCLYASIV